MISYHAGSALVGSEIVSDVRIDIEAGVIVAVTQGAGSDGAVRLRGVVIPGLVNTHSHAFHRALRGRTGAGSNFWEWRDLMHRAAALLDPDSYHQLARFVYVELALAGITTVGEFHYLHHPVAGRYAEPNAMGEALVAAAADAGIRLTLIDACYLRSGFDESATHVLPRFSDGSAEAWMERVGALRLPDMVRLGAAIHSVRAVDAESAASVAEWARERSVPLHLHLSEQQAENEACVAASGMTPTALLSSVGALGVATTAVHATHVTAGDVEILGGAGVTVCMCPTTERDLGDGIGPVPDLVAAGCRIAVGSDGHAVVDIIEEARLLDLHERLRSGLRGTVDTGTQIAAATEVGASALGWDAGMITPGRAADLVAIDTGSLRTAGISDPLQALLATGAANVTDVIVAGTPLVVGRRHLTVDHPEAGLDAAVRRLLDE